MRTSFGEGIFRPPCVPPLRRGELKGVINNLSSFPCEGGARGVFWSWQCGAVIIYCPSLFDQCVGRVLHEFFKERDIHVNIFRMCRDDDLQTAPQTCTGTGDHSCIVFQVTTPVNLHPLTKEVEF